MGKLDGFLLNSLQEAAQGTCMKGVVDPAIGMDPDHGLGMNPDLNLYQFSGQT